ncbi:MAG: hypothetical protein D6786_05640 [Gammaproteobacteria bacterium]|nr:MAG: hypothetical protein D6786_05640 [Gammaproteobacteria bacterium]
MSLVYDIAGNQIDGARDYQEDAFLITQLGDKNRAGALVIVADGMGGHAAGNVASNMAVQAFNKFFTSHYRDYPIHEVLRQATHEANKAIADTIAETAALKGMGCTLVAAYFDPEGKMWWVSVGDSHLYLLRKGELEKKNADHSYGGFLDRMAEAGKPVEPEEGFARNMLMSALTGEEIPDIDCPEEPLELQPGDRVILASDGLDTLSHGKLIYLSQDVEGAEAYMQALLDAVEEAAMPRQDNTTVVVVDVESSEKAVAPAPAEEPMELEEAAGTEITQPRQKAATQPPPTEPPPVEGGNTALLIGVAVVVVLLVLGGLGYFLFAGKGSGPVTTVAEAPAPQPAAEAPPPTEAPSPAEAPETPAPQPEPAETVPAPAPAPEAAARPEPEAAPAVTQAPEVAPAKAPATTAKVFRDPLRDGGKGPEMVWIPAGTFMMGSPDTLPYYDERPQHKVSVSRIAVSSKEITIEEYQRFAKATGRAFKAPPFLDPKTYPMAFVTWEDAFYYAKWLSKQTGKKYRLPSEAEWEYAARGGTDSLYWWGLKPGKGHAHCMGCGSPFEPRKPAPVGSFDPNPFGLYDTAGNLLEWVQDCWHPDYKGAPDDGSVWEGGDCSRRVARGGSFSSAPPSLRSAKRDSYPGNRRYDNIGIRLVREP